MRPAVPRDLRGHVEGIWIVPGHRGSGADRWRVVADPNPHLIAHRFPDGRVRAVVVGPRSRFVDVNHEARTYSVGIRLAPGASAALTRLPAHELSDRGVRLAGLFGAAGSEVQWRLEDAETPRRAVDVLIDFVRSRLSRAAEPDWRVRGFMNVLADTPGVAVGAAAQRLGVSPRTLRVVFAEQLGLSPKRTQRVHRVLYALSAWRAANGRPGARVAHRAGYVDQPHFVNECRAILGESPGRFLARARVS